MKRQSLLLLGWLLLATPVAVQAQFTYTTNNGTITITGYTGTNLDVVIPITINGLPVTSIGTNAFQQASINTVSIPDSVINIGDDAFSLCTSLTNVVIPNGVTSIGDEMFYGCSSLANVAVANSVTNIGDSAFFYCTSLTSISIPNNVSSIGDGAFYSCTGLNSVTIPESVTSIKDRAFYACEALTNVFFRGNAPSSGTEVFGTKRDGVYLLATVFYLPGTTGWGTNFAGLPTAVWLPQIETTGTGFGVQTNGFGFTVSWATNLSVVVEASTDLKNPTWSPVQTNALNNGVVNFTDPQWTNYPSRFYRVRSQ
jgi:hypothetical protein